MSSSNQEMSAKKNQNIHFVIDAFCLRQFDDPDYTGTKIIYDKSKFQSKVNELYENKQCHLVDGYAPFCKHLFIPNFTETRVNAVKITEDNKSLLESDYEARTPLELPVLTRWFPSHCVMPEVAKYLDIIVYSREQIIKENTAMMTAKGLDKDSIEMNHIVLNKDKDIPWGIIAVKAQNVNYELPMTPITMMRNALGKEEGGSGVPLNKDKYLACVDYWKNHAFIKITN